MVESLEITRELILQLFGDSLGWLRIDASPWEGETVARHLEPEAGASLGYQSQLIVPAYHLECVLGLHHHDPLHPDVIGAGGGVDFQQGSREVGATDSHLKLELTGLLIQVWTPAASLQRLDVKELLDVAGPEAVQGQEGGELEAFLGQSVQPKGSLLLGRQRFAGFTARFVFTNFRLLVSEHQCFLKFSINFFAVTWRQSSLKEIFQILSAS